MSAEFQKRGHPDKGYGLKPGRHLLGIPPRKDAATTLDSIPVPTSDCGLDEDPITALGIPDQGSAPYCVGHGWTSSTLGCQVRNGATAPQRGSRLWLMYMMHALEGDIGSFDGAMVADGAEVIERVGLPPESVLPYTDANPNPSMQKPAADTIRQAFDQKAEVNTGQIMTLGSHRIDDVLRALSAGGKGGKPAPVVFGTNVSNTFARNQLGPDFIVDAPDPNDIDGGHCLWIVRAVRDAGVTGGWKFRVQNSWSKDWGDGGYFWMTPKYLTDPSTDDLHFNDYQGVQS